MALTFPQIDPIIFSIGPFAVRWYGLMYVLAFIAATLLANRAVARSNGKWDKEEISDLLFYGMLGVVLGGRIGYVLFYQFPRFIEDPIYLFKITEGGMSFHGGLIGVVTAIVGFAVKKQKSILEIGDFAAPLVPLGLFFGRIGNFINGELWGRSTDVPWAMIFPTGGNVARHPSQLYEALLEGLLLFTILQWYSRKPRPLGSVGGLFLVGYGSFRFIVEYFREPDAHLGLFGGVISMGQILSLPMVFIGLGLIAYSVKRSKA